MNYLHQTENDKKGNLNAYSFDSEAFKAVWENRCAGGGLGYQEH
jgi:hypothetical protein